MYDKTQRIIVLSDYISKSLDISDNKNILRTAELSKCDLATKLVFEFTELQGFIGSDYAKIDNENNSVVLGIKEHYYPVLIVIHNDQPKDSCHFHILLDYIDPDN